MSSFLDLPSRPIKPRSSGITMVLDKGLSLSACADFAQENASFIDYVKFGWGTSIIYPHVKEKIEIYKKNGVQVCVGGTLFEVAYAQNKIDEFYAWAKDHAFDMVEVSDGTVDIERNIKLSLIEKFSADFTVLSEYGSKDGDKQYAPSQWVNDIQEELDAGAWKVVAEGRESGTAGLYRGTSELRTGLVSDIVDKIPHASIIWEAPQKSQQVWFIETLGANVNLGNISPQEALPLETLRTGLRSDTLLHFHSS